MPCIYQVYLVHSFEGELCFLIHFWLQHYIVLNYDIGTSMPRWITHKHMKTSGNPRKFIMMVYTWYLPDIWRPQVYTWNIPSIYLSYDNIVIWQVYTRYIPYVIYLSYTWYIPVIWNAFLYRVYTLYIPFPWNCALRPAAEFGLQCSSTQVLDCKGV